MALASKSPAKAGRPKSDKQAIRAEILSTAEAALKESAGQRLTLSDVASRMGRAPSYVHLYYSTKHELVASLAERWFCEVERAAQSADEAAEIANSPAARIKAQLSAVMKVKLEAFAEDPDLFRAYLRLASDHKIIVVRHTERLRNTMRESVINLVGAESADAAIELLEDATVQFRVPHMLAMAPERATPDRLNRVLDSVFLKLRIEGGHQG